MLRIEKVKLQGFKSFCDGTEVVFDPDGITAVVGPNGCGKSNVADALNWVIGEQRVKALRGAKMEDVIFQGSRNRQPSGMAEVTLTLRVEESFEVRTQESVKEEFKIRPEDIMTEDYQTQGDLALAPPPEQATEQPIVGKVKKRTIPKQTTHSYAEGERITIARRLYRTGDSEYEMNGRTCRLRDIQDLFAGTGLGASHYAIIEQGRIGQVLSGKPLDRRALIEEAAGISKFKLRQRAAELKLEAARQNLSRVTDIVTEVDRQQNSLKRQAAKARRYQRLREEMRGLMRAVYVTEQQTISDNIQLLKESRQTAVTKEAALIAQLAEAEALRITTISGISEVEARLLSSRTSANEITLQVEKLRQQRSFYEQQLQGLARRSEESARDHIAITERGQYTEQEAERLKSELQKIEQEINNEATSLSAAEAEHQALVKQDRALEIELEQAQAKVTEFATLRERWRQLLQQFSDAVARCERQSTGLKTEQERATQQEDHFTSESERLTEQLTVLAEKQEQISTSLHQTDKELATLNETKKNVEVQLSRLRQELTTVEQRRLSLLELDEKKSYFSEAVQAITRACKNKNGSAPFKILGTLADFVAVNAEQEKIIEIGLREEMQYLIAQTFDDAINAITFLKEGNLGRATFLVLDNGQAPHEFSAQANGGSPAVTKLIDLLGLKPELRSVLQRALPRLSDTIVAPEINQAITSSIRSNGKGQSYLTTSGEFISAGHLISGGSDAIEGGSILALKREIADLQEKLEQLSGELEAVSIKLAVTNEEIFTATQNRSALDQSLRQVEKEAALLRGQQQQAERDLERVRTHLRVVGVEFQQAQTELQEYQGKLSHAKHELTTAEASLQTSSTIAQETQYRVASQRQNTAERAQELGRRRADFAGKSERRNALQNEIRRLENEFRDISDRLSRSQLETLEAAEKSETIKASLITLQEEFNTNEELLREENISIESLNTDLLAIKAKLESVDSQLTSLRDNLTQLRESRSQLDIDRAKFVTNLEHLAANCYAELGETIDELIEKFAAPKDEVVATENLLSNITELQIDSEGETDEEAVLAPEPISVYQFPLNFSLPDGKIRLAELRAKIESLGPVNLLALEELGQAEERLTFLLEQKADIESAVSDTQAAIAEIKKRSRERFVDAFHAINKNFSEMFVELFGGGHGEMRLIDETDVLESGIDIIAQPPGKRLQNILLLSGGEKAMAALALIMGIFKYRPSPFCLLDEVDAPLDDANIGRFANKIIEMSSNTQFIVITHSKQTMEAASTLYGVTMEDPGVSKLISVKLK